MKDNDKAEKAARELAGNAGGHSNHTNGTPLLIGEQEAAKRLGISARKLWSLRRDGAIPFVTIDRRVLYPDAGLNAWIGAGCPTNPGAAASLNWKGGACS